MDKMNQSSSSSESSSEVLLSSYGSIHSDDDTEELCARVYNKQASMDATLIHDRSVRWNASTLNLDLMSFSPQKPYWHGDLSQISKAVRIIHDAFKEYLKLNPIDQCLIILLIKEREPMIQSLLIIYRIGL